MLMKESALVPIYSFSKTSATYISPPSNLAFRVTTAAPSQKMPNTSANCGPPSPIRGLTPDFSVELLWSKLKRKTVLKNEGKTYWDGSGLTCPWRCRETKGPRDPLQIKKIIKLRYWLFQSYFHKNDDKALEIQSYWFDVNFSFGWH